MPLHPFLPELCKQPELAACILAAMPLLQGKSFLEIDCENGYFCGYALSRYACPVMGLAKDERSMAEARGNFPECDFRLASSLPGARFDVVLSRDPMPADLALFQDCLSKLTARLRPGGTLLLTTPLTPAFLSGTSRHKAAPEHKTPSFRELARRLSAYHWRAAGSGDGFAVLSLRHRQQTIVMPPALRTPTPVRISA